MKVWEARAPRKSTQKGDMSSDLPVSAAVMLKALENIGMKILQTLEKGFAK